MRTTPEEPAAKRSRMVEMTAHATKSGNDAPRLGLVDVLELLAANHVLGARELGRLVSVSKAVAEQCKMEVIVANVCQAQWSGTSKLSPLLLQNNGGWCWLFRVLSSRLKTEPQATDSDSEDSESESDTDSEGSDSEDNSEASTSIGIVPGNAGSGSSLNIDDHVFLVNVYDDATGCAIVSRVLADDGIDNFGEFLESGELVIEFPESIALREFGIEDDGNFGFLNGPPTFSAALDILAVRDRTSSGIVVTGAPIFPDRMINTHNALWLDENEIMDETIDWKNVKREGVFDKGCEPLSLDDDFLLRTSQCIDGFCFYHATMRITTRVPIRSPRVFGLSSALAYFREEDVVANDFPLGVAAEETVGHFWLGGRSRPNLARFFHQAEEELNQLDANPNVMAEKIQIKLLCRTSDGRSSYCGDDSMGGINPRDVLGALL